MGHLKATLRCIVGVWSSPMVLKPDKAYFGQHWILWCLLRASTLGVKLYQEPLNPLHQRTF